MPTGSGTIMSSSLIDGRKHAKELDALYRISRILAMGVGERSMLAEILDILHDGLGMRSGTIMLVSPDRQELLVEVGHNLSRRQAQTVRYRMGEGISGRVVQTGKPAIVPKVSEEPQFLNRLRGYRKISKDEISFICVPISAGKEVIGALSVDRLFDESAPLDEDVRLLSIVASMIANDINARRRSAIEREALETENLQLRSQLEDVYRPENIIGNSDAMRAVYRSIQQVADSDTTVLIRGESGTGKELVAHASHYSSPRARNAFVKVNCAALSENLLESELFGHEKGAFTGAIQARAGRIEEADGGTLFLDEIGDFSLATQVRLLRFLQEREFERVGSNKVLKANVRVITATNCDLERAVEQGAFRKDLYYRVNVFPIMLPALRARKNDILLLADHFVVRYAKKLGKDVRRITTPAINMMVAYHWPGNVRELENCIERAVLLSNDGVIHGHHLPPTLQTSDGSDTIGEGTLQDRVDLFERDLIVDALKRNDGNVSSAARDLGSTPRIIRYKIENLRIDWKRYRPAGGGRE
jgi:Nif-specific regulatory protein